MNRCELSLSDLELRNSEHEILMETIDLTRGRYPFCVVWTPIPVLTWLCPFLGHMGICMSNGVIRDFAGPYFVSEDSMAFGKPTKVWRLYPEKAKDGKDGYDAAVVEASEIYSKRMHIIFYDNCHSHVATALNIMNYDGCSNWNMFKVAIYMAIHCKYITCSSYLKTWLPFISILIFVAVLAAFL